MISPKLTMNWNMCGLKSVLRVWANGQIISKRPFSFFNFFQKTNKNTLHSSKNEFICLFLEEFTAWQFAFEINWPLENTQEVSMQLLWSRIPDTVYICFYRCFSCFTFFLFQCDASNKLAATTDTEQTSLLVLFFNFL